MQVIEKVKVVPDGYNGAGMNYDGGNRRSAGTSILGGAGGGMLDDDIPNHYCKTVKGNYLRIVPFLFI